MKRRLSRARRRREKERGREGKRSIPSEAEARKRPLWLHRTLFTGAVWEERMASCRGSAGGAGWKERIRGREGE